MKRLLLLACLAPLFAAAQEDLPAGRLQVDRFELRVAPGAVLGQPSSQVLAHNQVYFGLGGFYTRAPLSLAPNTELGDTRDPVVVIPGRLHGQVLAGYGLGGFSQFGVFVPFSGALGAYETSFAGRTSDQLKAFALGDIRVRGEIDLTRLIGGERPNTRGFGLEIGVTGWLPTGNRVTFDGEGPPRIEPRLAFDWLAPIPVRFGGNVGLHLRNRSRVFTIATGPAVRWGGVVQVSPGLEWLRIMGTVYGEHALPLTPADRARLSGQGLDPANYEIDAAYDPIEWMAGVGVTSPFGLDVQAAAGTGLNRGVGSPAFRFMVQVGLKLGGKKRWDEGSKDDFDGEGIPNELDVCPYEAELDDEIRDEDGCPEAHGEREKVSVTVADPGTDVAPGMPYQPAAVAGLPQLQRRRDSDGDGIWDDEDLCPDEPETVDGYKDTDGCPDPDDDGDGIVDEDDACRFEAEAFNGVEDEDGCPDLAPDEDGDSVPDMHDLCPLEPETENGIRDEDGCPEATHEDAVRYRESPEPVAEAPAPAPVPQAGPSPLLPPLPIDRDLDGDGLGIDDLCPEAPEDLDGFLDGDGCPDDDNDNDGIVDSEDSCPLQAEVPNGVQDQDGCPDAIEDLDGDGVPDADDVCPYEPEWHDDRRDGDGCPEAPPVAEASVEVEPPRPPPAPPMEPPVDLPPLPVEEDADGDGLYTSQDVCPDQPEDMDGFLDADGCPDEDNDRDGVLDVDDQCPDEAETRNYVQDEDGCPEPGDDSDADGVDDVVDRCPYEPETRNGVRDHDGCPELAAEIEAKVVRKPPPTEGTMAPVAAALPPPPKAKDSDGDGILDFGDACPDQPEDLDGFEDRDGCPEDDNDGDGVIDRIDRCPMEAENINGVLDDDGCPDRGPDRDFDLVDDADDLCPYEPENIDGVRDEDGCPEVSYASRPAFVNETPTAQVRALSAPQEAVPSPRRQGLAPVQQQQVRPATLVVLPNLEPGWDVDGDGLLGEEDLCIDEAEDMDGFVDGDGCPDPDNDFDGILDVVDACPGEAETPNNFEDNDGCPDSVPLELSKLSGVVRGITFDAGKSTLRSSSFDLLRDVLEVLNTDESLILKVAGHTDDTGDRRKNLELSLARATAVGEWLVAQGIPWNRLQIVGWGPDQPLESNRTRAGRAVNRRVELSYTRK